MNHTYGRSETFSPTKRKRKKQMKEILLDILNGVCLSIIALFFLFLASL
jgi:hypothetical protein